MVEKVTGNSSIDFQKIFKIKKMNSLERPPLHPDIFHPAQRKTPPSHRPGGTPSPGGHWFCQLTVCAAKKMAFKITPLQCNKKIGEIHTLTVHFPQIFYPFREKNQTFWEKSLVFPGFAEISTLTVHFSKAWCPLVYFWLSRKNTCLSRKKS